MTKFNKNSRLGFIGAGAVGGSLAVGLSLKGYNIEGVSSRTYASAENLANRIEGCTAYRNEQAVADNADIVFITTPDDMIPKVSQSISWIPGQGVVHCSGASSTDIFDSATKMGAIPGAAHPLQAFSSIDEGVENLPGITFGIEGDPAMKLFLQHMAEDLNCTAVFLRPEDKAIYHITAVMLGGLLLGYTAAVSALWDHIGLDRPQALNSLLGIMKGSINNMTAQGMPNAMAGPYTRGDIGTIKKHVETLNSTAPDILQAYIEVAKIGLPFSVDKGSITEEQSKEITDILNGYKGDS